MSSELETLLRASVELAEYRKTVADQAAHIAFLRARVRILEKRIEAARLPPPPAAEIMFFKRQAD